MGSRNGPRGRPDRSASSSEDDDGEGVPLICDSTPAPLTGDELDPAEVYLLGTLLARPLERI